MPRDSSANAGRLQGKVAVVTGGASGIGRAVCIAFAREGATVVVGDTNPEASTDGFADDRESTTVEAIRRTGADALFVSCDVTDKMQVTALVRAAVDTYGRLDVIVNNAGVFRTGKLTHEYSEEDFDICWTVNVKGTLFDAQEAVKQFLAQADGGCIINVVSTSGLQGHPRQSAYNTSKGAQANLTRCLAIDYGSSGIRVNSICPTFVRTQMTRAFVDDPDRFEFTSARASPSSDGVRHPTLPTSRCSSHPTTPASSTETWCSSMEGRPCAATRSDARGDVHHRGTVVRRAAISSAAGFRRVVLAVLARPPGSDEAGRQTHVRPRHTSPVSSYAPLSNSAACP